MASKQRVDVRAPVAAPVAPGYPVAGISTWETRSGRGADLFIDGQPSGNRKTKRRTRREDSANTAAGFACDLRGWTRSSEASGIDIMLVLDVSGSMLTKDFTIGGQEATRVDAIREVTRKFIEERPNDRIGIIAFAGRPYVVSPMTLDHDWLLQNLDRVRIGLVEDGTAIGSAMAAAANRLNDKHSKSRVLVLLTDGENNAGKIPPNTAAEAVKALKIHFYAIGAGITGIAPAPIFTTRGPLTDALGNILYENQRVEFNEIGLREVAKIADGKFFRATDTKSLEQIYNDIDNLEKSTVSVKKYQQYRDLFPLCLMSGCGLLLAQILLSQTIWKKLP